MSGKADVQATVKIEIRSPDGIVLEEQSIRQSGETDRDFIGRVRAVHEALLSRHGRGKEAPDLAGARRRVSEAIFRMASLNGVQGLTLDGLGAEDLRRLELAVQHIQRHLDDLSMKLGRARRGLP